MVERAGSDAIANAANSANSGGVMLPQSFPRERRIVKTDEFSSVFNLRPVYRTAHFVLYTRPTMLPLARLGVVAAKRLAPRAVEPALVAASLALARRDLAIALGLCDAAKAVGADAVKFQTFKAENLVTQYFGKNIKYQSGELCVEDNFDKKLPLGTFLRFQR